MKTLDIVPRDPRKGFGAAPPWRRATAPAHGKGLLLLLGFLLTATASYGFCDEWRAQDTVLASTMTALMLADWNQTRQIASKPDRIYAADGSYTITPYETNPVLGKHPHAQDVNVYFASTLATQLLGGCLLHAEYRSVWFSGWIGFEIAYVGNNAALGIGVNF